MIAITIRSSIRVKILVFILRSKNIEQGILKEKIEKQWNNRTLEQFSNRVKKRGRAGIDCALSCCRNEILLLWNFIIKNSINVKIFFSLPIFFFLSSVIKNRPFLFRI